MNVKIYIYSNLFVEINELILFLLLRKCEFIS